MTEYNEEDVLELLNGIFVKCDIDERGAVDVNKLITFLISQDESFQRDERIEQEIRRLLNCNNSNQLITQSYFTRTIFNWFKTLFCNVEEIGDNEGMLPAKSGGVCSSQSSGIGEEEELSPVNTMSSTEDFPIVNFVSDGQNFTSEGIVDGIDIEERENLQSYIKLVQHLENKVSSLHRKNESLNNANNLLNTQMSSWKDNYEKETSAHLKKMESNTELIEHLKQKEEEAAEKLSKAVEDKKSITIELSQCERDNSKLKEHIKNLEKQVDILSNEKEELEEKVQKLKRNVGVLSDMRNKSLGDLESLRVKEELGKKSLKALFGQNETLRSQLESNALYIQNLKSELTTANQKLSTLQIAKMDSFIEYESSLDGSIPESSMMFCDNKYSLESSIPIESSLLAELQGKVYCYQCNCEYMKNEPFPETSSVSTESITSTEEKSFKDSGTMTSQDVNENVVTCKDVGINCSIKTPESTEVTKPHCEKYNLTSKRSLTKWIFLGFIIMLLSFLIGFVCSSILLIQTMLESPYHLSCLSSLIDLLPITLEHSYIPI